MKKLPLVVVLDNVRSAMNVGSFFRTCDAFGVERLMLCGICAVPPSREIYKTSLGAELSVEWEHFDSTEECLRKLREEGYELVAVEQIDGAALLENDSVSSDGKYAYVFGNEVEGVGQAAVDMCDRAVEIPQMGTKHSLNVAVSGGAVLWHLFEQLYRKI